MYLKSLTMRGFKSFASSTTMVFEPGVTCVVGPNGSGKSNVVDALAWVMGEQGAKTLRGGKMEDVIFAGTSGRAPLGRAEVELKIDNSDGALPIDYTEVTISRTMFRSGGSEYAINGTPARLLDVQELLSDSGIGREMHVIVGQGQLDSILQATPEIRRGFIEEAAGVLKHRKRKEKAERKLESTAANLNRLNDLLGEIRRQLKPLGRQAEVARKAAVVQAEVRDARARLLAEDLATASQALESDLAAEAELKQRRLRLEEQLTEARQAEQLAEAAAQQALPRLAAAQETWYSLAGLAERVSSTATIAAERLRNAEAIGTEERPGRDPEAIEREAAEVVAAEAELGHEIESLAAALTAATEARTVAEAAHTEAEQQYAAQQRAIADRREGLARLIGEVNTLRSRVEAAASEIDRLAEARAQADERGAQAKHRFASLETRLAGLSAGESGLDAAYEVAAEAEANAEAERNRLTDALRAAAAERGALAARAEALALGLNQRDGGAALLAAGNRLDGLLGSVAALIKVNPGDQVAIAAALGAAADAVAVTGVDAAVRAFDHLKTEDLGRAGLLLGGGPSEDPASWPKLPTTARWAIDTVECEERMRPPLQRLLFKVALVADLATARELVTKLPEVSAVTADGDLLSSWFAAGGSAGQPSVIEVQAALDEANAKLAAAQTDAERLRFAVAKAEDELAAAKQRAEAALARLHESDAEHGALAEEAAELNQTVRAALAEAGRLSEAAQNAATAREQGLANLSDLERRLELAEAQTELSEADPTQRDHSSDVARAARAAEMEARLGLRTVEERARALAGRAESLTRAAQAERDARAKAAARREQLRREAETAASVQLAATWLAGQIGNSRVLAEAERTAAQQARAAAEGELSAARQRGRELAKQFEGMVDTVHRDELARAQQQMKIEALAEKALAELGLDAAVLLADYGPQVPVPLLLGPDGAPLGVDDEPPEPVPYVRAEQEKRLRAAERDLAVLGKVNPLALEEFEAMSERHAFLAEQLVDLRKTREDLMEIISDVDTRVQEVFAAAYADVEAAFADSFSRLFPGGEGRLVLTEPGEWLTTGVDVEARPAGKKVKRLSLLSGGERSLVAVAFLVALFKARPSPFYILDEVEAALDDVNLGRLLEIYQELRNDSQLLVITHQKRTMEIADALYGVTMRADGVTTVISQRLRES
ncbi:chromosome segregation protein SMC [Propionicimonas sp.]|uniref:chromosome segregation protein SMC n=1 Tax=Propionicimonas sp. TaxID=1955623 RepID=UPI001799B2D9|nr:chromosome segregation protein SMC [Propionicimonas sp.]MBU3976205.1 chromosome segregation protein SMC [Actinomycetota bacterium]MBA3021017.1 chromosome segregation protein SMC [Propionicimonas sp.]MBU3985600.1 chromosome segregation protein SMC [Actinomycetota bacterium]MBU4008385.1 chromosome segregation protein SMC [Actinomycetota bacterium]MBU4066465.1 chromosome segregation protein SMC [Actinomycetota bacterium]